MPIYPEKKSLHKWYSIKWATNTTCFSGSESSELSWYLLVVSPRWELRAKPQANAAPEEKSQIWVNFSSAPLFLSKQITEFRISMKCLKASIAEAFSGWEPCRYLGAQTVGSVLGSSGIKSLEFVSLIFHWYQRGVRQPIKQINRPSFLCVGEQTQRHVMTETFSNAIVYSHTKQYQPYHQYKFMRFVV